MSERKPIYPPTYLLVAMLLMVGLHFVVPITPVVTAPLRYVGAAFVGLGLGLILWCALLFHRAKTTITPFERPAELVVRGPYRVSRNPIYVGMLCLLLGTAVLLGSLTPFVVLPVFAWSIDRRFIRVEETMLARAFGSRYDAYRGSVGRWL
jgi:protein-S-isoprenylcysteine O-methyltransferase Ste14